MGIVFQEGISIRGALESDNATYSVEDLLEGTTPVNTSFSYKDGVFQKQLSTGVANNFAISGGNKPLINLTPSVVTLDENNKVRLNADVQGGTAKIVYSNDYSQRVFERPMLANGSVSKYEILSAQPGSLREYIDGQVTDAFINVTPGGAAQRAGLYGNGIAAGLASQVLMSGSYGGVNPNNFLRTSKGRYVAPPLDVLDQLLDNTGPDGWKAWITPHHYITWESHDAKNSSTSRVYETEVVVRYSSTRWNGALCKLLPTDWKKYWPELIPGGVGREFKNCFTRLYNTYDGKSNATAERRWVQPTYLGIEGGMSSHPLSQYQKRNPSNGFLTYPGDSGSPSFITINGNLVILAHTVGQWVVGSLGTTFLANISGWIQSAVTALNASGNFTIQFVDLSGFNQYPLGHDPSMIVPIT